MGFCHAAGDDDDAGSPGIRFPTCTRASPRCWPARGLTPEAVTALLDFDTANFQWNRVVGKGEMLAAILRGLGLDLEPAHFHGLIAMLRIRCGVGRPATEPTIGLVAEEMSVDPSRASRIVADLVGRGFVRREAMQQDGRKSVLSVTARGQGAARCRPAREMARSWREVFRDWDPADIASFARGVRAYTEGVQAALARGCGPAGD